MCKQYFYIRVAIERLIVEHLMRRRGFASNAHSVILLVMLGISALGGSVEPSRVGSRIVRTTRNSLGESPLNLAFVFSICCRTIPFTPLRTFYASLPSPELWLLTVERPTATVQLGEPLKRDSLSTLAEQ